MKQVILYSLTSVTIISLISLIGVLFLSFNKKIISKIILVLVAFAAGSLIGDAFIHLIPEIIENTGFTISTSIYLLVGILVFFIMEKFMRWRHCHVDNCENHNVIGSMNLFGDAFHNFIDGIIIAGSFMVNIPLGIATTIAVLLHEIPQEIGDFGVLIHSGYSKKRAILLNFLISLSAIFGVILVFIFGNNNATFIINFIIPFTAGGFIYIAMSDLIPELHKDTGVRNSIWQLVFFIFGIILMSLLLLIE